MKKYLLLTSIFALAACGGGSGGTYAPESPVFSSGVYTNTASNRNVTQMKTQIIVDSNGNIVNPAVARVGSARSGSIQDTNGNSYKVYDLSDVKFNVADQNIGSSNPSFLKIGLAADGAIKDITLSTDGTESKLARDGNTNHFRGPIFEYVADGDDRALYRVVDNGQTLAQLNNISMSSAVQSACEAAGGCHWNRIDERLDIETNKHISAGMSGAKVLQYSDFGHFNPVYRTKHTELTEDVLTAIREHGAEIEAALSSNDFDQDEFNTLVAGYGLNRTDKDKYRNNEEFAEELQSQDYQLFAGGYAIGADGKPVADGSFEAPRNTTFTGTAIGRVYTSIHAENEGTEQEYKDAILAQFGVTGDGHDIARTFKTDSAQLTVDAAGNQKLVMNFPDFYKVTATKTVGGAEDGIRSKQAGVDIEKQYMKTNDVAIPTYTDETHQVINHGTTGDPEVMFKPGYYGVGSASEAAGVTRYAEDTTGIDVKDTEHNTTKTFDREFEFQGAYGLKK